MVNASRIRLNEEQRLTFRQKNFEKLMKEIDSRLSGADCHSQISRFSTGVNAGLVENIEIFSEASFTNLVAKREYSYQSGGLISGYIDIFYNDDNSEDSRITTTITRNGAGLIINCNSDFSTTEPDPC